MIGRLTALILLSTVSLVQTAEVPRLISLTEVELGDSVTLICPVSATQGLFFQWYKQSLGHIAQKVASGLPSGVTVAEQFKDSRFTVTNGDDQSLLTIRNVSKEDEATYFCHTGTMYSYTYHNGTFVAVNDHKNQRKQNYVKQSPEKASVQLGDSVTLQCSLLSKNKENRVQCPGEHSVHWFRSGSGGFHPGIIYTHSSRSDEQEGRSCVYSLSKTMQDSSDAGTYYCAVVTCGEILFGEGTKVETGTSSDSGSEVKPVVFVLGGLLACCLTVIVFLICCVYQSKACKHCKGTMSASHQSGHDRSTMDRSNHLDGKAEEVNYAALNFSARKAKRLKTRESPQECLYSAVVYQPSS